MIEVNQADMRGSALELRERILFEVWGLRFDV